MGNQQQLIWNIGFFSAEPSFLFFIVCFARKAPPDSAALSLFLPSFASVSVWFLSVQELERFKGFVKRKPTFDVVVDGLNVANINKDKSRQSETVGKHAAAHAATAPYSNETDPLRKRLCDS